MSNIYPNLVSKNDEEKTEAVEMETFPGELNLSH